MHRPGPELGLVTEKTLAEFHFDTPVDVDSFIAQYDVMLRLIQSHGVETILLRDVLAHDEDALAYIDHRPNMTYTRDLAAVFSRGAVLMRPYLKGRWGDQEMMARAFARLGVPILGAIEPPGYLEGGGVTIIGEDTAVASLCDRANETGTRALRDIVLGHDVEFFLEVPLPYGEIHIDGLFMVLDEKLCMIQEEALSVFPCRLYRAGRPEPRHVMFRDFLDQRGFELIPFTAEEHLTHNPNVVITKRSRSAVSISEATGTVAEMERRGWDVSTFPSDVFRLGNGGPHCMTCPVWVG
jgi:N-dimethylarginine dimethylaminohydrolase